MATTDRITMNVGTHGQFQTNARGFDELLDTYFYRGPFELDDLKQEIASRTEIDYSDLTTLTECLMVLAELDGYATN